MKFGINLYGVLKNRRDVPAALQELRDMGFRSVEPCVAPAAFEGMEHVFWPADRLKDRLEEIRAMGLEVFSVHLVGWNPSVQRETLKELAVTCGIRHFVVKSPQVLTEAALHEAALAYTMLAEALETAGAEVLLHNERDDIAARFAGKTAYERLIDLCMGKVGAQVDAGWALAGGEDPEALLWRMGDRVRSLHYKDYSLSEGGAAPAVLGKGDLDLTACLQFARFSGIPQIVDPDAFGGNPAEELRESLGALASRTQEREPSASFLNTLDVVTGEIKTIRRFDRVIEAPNWLKNSNAMIYNSQGHIWRLDLDAGTETMIDSGECEDCNNDHVVSPDETLIAVSDSPWDKGIPSRVYVLPIGGGRPRLVTPEGPSFLHGWSPDGQEFAYCAFRERNGALAADIFTIPFEGGEEKRLTSEGFNDGPEYSPDGKQIWFISTRTGLMQVWRMNRDGSGQTQMTFTERNNWFGHVSPDGQRVVYLSYGREDLEANEHLPNMRVELRLMNADGSDDHRLLTFFGGQGSINVNSWAADSRHLAFVSYELRHR